MSAQPWTAPPAAIEPARGLAARGDRITVFANTAGKRHAEPTGGWGVSKSLARCGRVGVLHPTKDSANIAWHCDHRRVACEPSRQRRDRTARHRSARPGSRSTAVPAPGWAVPRGARHFPPSHPPALLALSALQRHWPTPPFPPSDHRRAPTIARRSESQRDDLCAKGSGDPRLAPPTPSDSRSRQSPPVHPSPRGRAPHGRNGNLRRPRCGGRIAAQASSACEGFVRHI
jgi:hypothetical protein